MNIEEAIEECRMLATLMSRDVPELSHKPEAIDTVLNELEKKDKIINEMATILSSICTGIELIRKQFDKEYCEFKNSEEDCCWKTDKECSDCIKEYFTNKVEKEGD